MVQQNVSDFWEQACPTMNYIHLSTKARIASNCIKAVRTEVAGVVQGLAPFPPRLWGRGGGGRNRVNKITGKPDVSREEPGGAA